MRLPAWRALALATRRLPKFRRQRIAAEGKSPGKGNGVVGKVTDDPAMHKAMLLAVLLLNDQRNFSAVLRHGHQFSADKLAERLACKNMPCKGVDSVHEVPAQVQPVFRALSYCTSSVPINISATPPMRPGWQVFIASGV